MNILFTVCGRAGSKGIKNKNLKTFCGKHLAYYTISVIDLFLRHNPQYGYVIAVNSDSTELLELIQGNGIREIYPIERDSSLAGDRIGKIAVIQDCYEKVSEQKSTSFDLVVDLDITSPLRTVQDLENVIRIHMEKKPDVTTTVAPARRNPYFNQVRKTEHGVKKVIDSDFTARQQAPEIYDMNAAIYAYRPSFLQTGKGVLDGYCEIVEMKDTGILDLDHENDLELMEVIGAYLFEKYDDYKVIYQNIK